MLVRKDFKPFETKVWLGSPTMHGPEFEYMAEAYRTNWGWRYIMDNILGKDEGE